MQVQDAPYRGNLKTEENDHLLNLVDDGSSGIISFILHFPKALLDLLGT